MITRVHLKVTYIILIRLIFFPDFDQMEEKDTDDITHPHPATSISSNTVQHDSDIKAADTSYTFCQNTFSRETMRHESDISAADGIDNFCSSSSSSSKATQVLVKAEPKHSFGVALVSDTIKADGIRANEMAHSPGDMKQKPDIKQLDDNSNEDTRDMTVKIESAGESDVTDNNIPKYWSVNTYHESKYLNSLGKTEKDDASNGMSYISQQRVGTDNNVAR